MVTLCHFASIRVNLRFHSETETSDPKNLLFGYWIDEEEEEGRSLETPGSYRPKKKSSLKNKFSRDGKRLGQIRTTRK